MKEMKHESLEVVYTYSSFRKKEEMLERKAMKMKKNNLTNRNYSNCVSSNHSSACRLK